MAYIIQLRRDLAANWSAKNSVLAAGELGIETDTTKAKLGNGTTAWNSLAYWNPGGTDTDNYDPAGTSAAETTRAEAAEALLLPKSGGTMSGPLDMGSNPIHHLGSPSVWDDVANKGYVDALSLNGDVTGSPSTTLVGQIQGVGITVTEAKLVSDLNNATTRSAGATIFPGEETIFTGSTASQTLTLPVSAPNSTVNTITNAATVSVTLAPGAGSTLNNFGTTGNVVIPSGYSFAVVYIGTVWYVQQAGPSDFAKNNALAVANGGTGAATASSALTNLGAAPLTDLPWALSDLGFLIASMSDPAMASSTSLMVAGTVYLVRVNARAAMTLSTIWFYVATAGAGASTGSYVGLYNSSGTLLSGSSDIGASLTASGYKNISLTSAQALTAGSFYWITLLSNLATTQPNLGKSSIASTLANFNLPVTQFRVAVNGTSQTSLPATISPSLNTASGSFMWFVAGT